MVSSEISEGILLMNVLGIAPGICPEIHLGMPLGISSEMKIGIPSADITEES